MYACVFTFLCIWVYTNIQLPFKDILQYSKKHFCANIKFFSMYVLLLLCKNKLIFLNFTKKYLFRYFCLCAKNTLVMIKYNRREFVCWVFLTSLTRSHTAALFQQCFSLYKMRELGSTVRRGTQNETCVCSKHIVVCVYQIKYMHFCVCVKAKNKRTHRKKWECIVGMGWGCLHTNIEMYISMYIETNTYAYNYMYICIWIYVHIEAYIYTFIQTNFPQCEFLTVYLLYYSKLGVWDTYKLVFITCLCT